MVEVKPNLNEIFTDSRDNNLAVYRNAFSQGKTLTQYLNDNYPQQGELDAFETLLKEKGIVTKSDPAKGIWASKVEAFFTTEESAGLFPETVNRIARQALEYDPILSELVGIRTPIDSDAYRSIYIKELSDTTTKVSKRRVTEGAELPVAELKTSENTIKIYKYGRRIKATYEAIRRIRIDKWAKTVEAIMLQASLDRAADAYATLINGDGNDNAATIYKHKADLAGSATGKVEYKPWTKFLLKFYPYQMSILVGEETGITEFLSKTAPDIDPIKLMELLQNKGVNQQGTIAQSIFNNYRIVFLPDATDNYLLGLDKRYALEMVSEVGADITETGKIISSQWNEMTLSETNGFAIFLPKARRVLDIGN